MNITYFCPGSNKNKWIFLQKCFLTKRYVRKNRYFKENGVTVSIVNTTYQYLTKWTLGLRCRKVSKIFEN